MELNDDGSMKNATFSKVQLPYPESRPGESYASYRKRVSELVTQGFHLGDLGWSDYMNYCKGSGCFEGVDSNDLI